MRALGWALWALGWLAGCALQLQMPVLWHPSRVTWLVAGAAALAALAWAWRRRRAGLTVGLAVAVLLGFCTTHWRAGMRLAEELPTQLQGQDLVVTGVVASLPREGPDGTRFVFEVDEARHRGALLRIPERLSQGWSRGFDDDA